MIVLSLATGIPRVIDMLSQYFEATTRIEAIRSGPSGALIEGFSNQLFERGYSEIAARRHIRSAEHLMRWASRQGLSSEEIDERVLARFGGHLRRCNCNRFRSADRRDVLAGARFFLRHLQGVENPAIRESKPSPEEPEILRSFYEWMRQQRGTSDGTLYNYSLPLRAFIKEFGEDLARLDARLLRQFVLKQSRSPEWTKPKRCTTALRMFLRFLITEGRCRPGLLGGVPVVARWRLTALPRYFAPEDVERIIASCDSSTAMGKRDRAILLLLARLGLRAGDIVQMSLGDIDWKEGWIQVSGKSRRQTRLPLSQEVGEAIVTYLQHVRPHTHDDALFVRTRAPFGALGSHAAVSVIVAGAIRRAKVKRPARGAAHLLRHSVASSMLREGASLQDIAVLLRHRSVETTQIYAKVDVKSLQKIAQPWPTGGAPC
jgi:site-specific recombinase XerD